MMQRKSVVMVAGEASGDLHGSHLIQALRKKYGEVDICGMGGRAMRNNGAKILVDSDSLAVVGITEVLAKLSEVLGAMSLLKKTLAEQRPDLLVLIDYPEFNLHLANTAKKLGIPVLYYISPQLWAWRSGRVKKIKKRVDHMAVILPFEADFYERNGMPVTFVGHPLMDSAIASTPPRPPALPEKEEVIIGLLPGSRTGEITSLLPKMLAAGALLEKQLGSRVRFLLSCAPSIKEEFIHSFLEGQELSSIEVTDMPVRELFPKCHLAIVASGTVTLEAAICTTPTIITYMVSPLSYRLGRALIKVDHIGLVNLIAEKRIIPELVQHQVTPRAICETAATLLADPDAYRTMCEELAVVKERLGAPGASDKVADIAQSLMDRKD